MRERRGAPGFDEPETAAILGFTVSGFTVSGLQVSGFGVRVAPVGRISRGVEATTLILPSPPSPRQSAV